MFETVSVFDAMELDNTQRRVASRRALALAHNRVESNLGRFLRAAQSEEEFFERLALVQEDFEGYVMTASEEVGHEHPEHIASALKDHYHLAADKVEFVQTPAEKQEDEEEEKVAAAPIIPPKSARKALKRMAKAGRSWQVVAEGKQGSPLGNEPVAYGQNDQGQYPVMPGDEAHHTCPGCGSFNHRSNPVTGEPECLDCGYTGSENPYGPYGQDSDENYRQRDLGGYGGRDAKVADMYTPDHDEPDVTCPECGGDGKTAGAATCGKCHGNGKVPNFGSPDTGQYVAAENHNNTDLDGPEPKMDKRLWTPENPGKPDYEDGPRHPTKEKDITEVIGPARNDHEVEEIHGQGTHYKHEELPANSGDAGFDDGGPGPAPHTKTFGDNGTDPVTHQTLEAVQSSADDIHKNPLVDLLLAEWPADAAVTAAFKS